MAVDARPAQVGRSRDAWSASLRYLASGAAVLDLSVETPERISGWDAIVLTASNRRQASLYEHRLAAARRRGLIAQRTLTLVADDPGGKRIGSGGATLNALRALQAAAGTKDITAWRVLLIHAGGDSRRVPWASVLGKCFIPFPLFADPDRGVPSVLDHQLAVAAPIALHMPQGGLLSLAGDVLPLFDASRMRFPSDAACVVTTPAALDVAERHGVIVAGDQARVVRLLQKQPAEVLEREGALVGGGAALLDTGIYAFAGQTARALTRFACSDPNPVDLLIEKGAGCSLYEQIAAALVPSQYEWLGTQRLGGALLEALRGGELYHHEAPELQFVHFGSTSEVLWHLGHAWGGRLLRNVLAERGSAVAPTALILASSVADGASVGEGSMVYGCRIGRDCRIGRRCAVVDVSARAYAFTLPDNCCMWQVPLAGGTARSVLACCGADDNPKLDMDSGTFCNEHIAAWMKRHGVDVCDLWEQGQERSLWNAKLFVAGDEMLTLRMAQWLLDREECCAATRDAWRDAERISMADIGRELDEDAFEQWEHDVRTGLALEAIRRTASLALERNVGALAGQLGAGAGNSWPAEAIDSVPGAGEREAGGTPRSRLVRIKADIARAAGQSARAGALDADAFRAVQDEVRQSVAPYEPPETGGLAAGSIETVELPVRFDIAGGWSDTPPYCLERPARVLNLAMSLNGECPVGASVETLAEPVWELILADSDQQATVRDGEDLAEQPDLSDPFTLPRTALVLAGFGAGRRITQGVRVRTWARVPRGSGLGTSSILGAALVTALQRICGRPDDTHTVSDLVLTLEQRMTTGGGWQDQVGGLVSGVKCTSSAPVTPIKLQVEPVPLLPGMARELEQRLVIAFTGLERLAKNVLQIVVGRYLSRDNRALDAIGRLVELADEGRGAVALGDLDALGRVMGQAWAVHQELDPHCSNVAVDEIMRRVEDYSVGAKLAGAGGGGFAGVMAKDAEAASRIRHALAEMGNGVAVYDWKLA